MQIILLEKVINLGNLGDVVKVKDGYARNFLIPKRMAKRATPAAMAEFEARRAELEKIAADKLVAAQGVADKMAANGWTPSLAIVMLRCAAATRGLRERVVAARARSPMYCSAASAITRRYAACSRCRWRNGVSLSNVWSASACCTRRWSAPID